MVDNIDVTPGTGKTIAADDVGGALYQRVKVTYGADGSATDASATNPLPVTARNNNTEYETVAASQTDQVLGATGAAGDFLSHIIIQPATTGAGTVTVKDGTTVIYTFTSGTLADLTPIIVPFGLVSVNGAWKVTTGANVAVIGCGDFA